MLQQFMKKKRDSNAAFAILPLLHNTDRNFVDNFLKVVIYLALVANI